MKVLLEHAKKIERQKYTNLFLAFILCYFALFSLLYVFISRPMEGPDEREHLHHINVIAATHRIADPYDKEGNSTELHQPPLYYFITAGIVHLLAEDNKIDVHYQINAHLGLNFHLDPSTRPLYAYMSSSEQFEQPSDQYIFYLLRLLSVFFGITALFFAYHATRLFFCNERWALISTFIIASLPKIQYLFSVISNDVLLLLFCSLLYYTLFAILRCPEKRSYYILLGALIGLGLITKKSIFALLPVVVISLFLNILIHRSTRLKIARNIFYSSIASIAVAGWWFARNILIYGDILASTMEIETNAHIYEPKGIFSNYFLGTFWSKFSTSFIASFGWGATVSHYVYYFYAFFAIISLCGIFLAIIHFLKSKKFYQQQLINYFVVVFSPLFMLFGVLYYNTQFSQARGRFLLPAIVCISILITVGLKYWFDFLARQSSFFSRLISLVSFCGIIVVDVVVVIAAVRLYGTPENFVNFQ